MKKRIRISLFLLLAVTLSLVEGAFAQINSDSLISVYTKKMQKYLDKENKASEVFSFTKEGIEVYIPATDTSQRKLESAITWDEIKKHYFSTDTNKAHTTKNNLAGLKIALDPGHLAGDLETAKMEKKWVEMKPVGNSSNGLKTPPLQLIEGELTLATALILKKKLEAHGAEVMLTRYQPNISAFGIDFVKWMDSLFISSIGAAYERGDVSFEEKNYLLTKANNIEIFRRFFLLEDLRERARKINSFQPDLTLLIHYNVDETNVNWNKPTKKDYNMAFVGGSFTADELDKPEARIEFLRLLLTDDIERSVEFSKYMMESLVQKTGVPAALDSNAVYLKDNCMKTEVNGVYCRNLTLTRKVKGVVCYGESHYQDNINECKALSKKDVKIGEMETSKRVEEVAEAYFQGIMNYVKDRKP